MNKPKLNQPDVEQTTTFNNEIDNIPFGKTYSIEEYRELIRTRPAYPTLEEVKQEWEDDNYMWKENLEFIHIINNETWATFVINKIKKEYFVPTGTIPLKIHNRLTKTFIALGGFDE